ncbi:MAG: hypothetical protein U0136_21915 [Bdellovibrionota bacterium]
MTLKLLPFSLVTVFCCVVLSALSVCAQPAPTDETSVLGTWYMQDSSEALGIKIVTDMEIEFRPDHWAIIQDRGRVADSVANETFRSPWTYKDSTVILENVFSEKYLVSGTYHRDPGELTWKLRVVRNDGGETKLMLPDVDTPFVRNKRRQGSIAGIVYDIAPGLIAGVLLLLKSDSLAKRKADEQQRKKFAKRFRILGVALLIISLVRLAGVLVGGR